MQIENKDAEERCLYGECPICQKQVFVELTPEEYEQFSHYGKGDHIQDLMPNTEADVREFLMGYRRDFQTYCNECQEMLFSTKGSGRIKEAVDEDDWVDDEDEEPLGEGLGTVAKQTAKFVMDNWDEITKALKAAGVAASTIKEVVDKLGVLKDGCVGEKCVEEDLAGKIAGGIGGAAVGTAVAGPIGGMVGKAVGSAIGDELHEDAEEPESIEESVEEYIVEGADRNVSVMFFKAPKLQGAEAATFKEKMGASTGWQDTAKLLKEYGYEPNVYYPSPEEANKEAASFRSQDYDSDYIIVEMPEQKVPVLVDMFDVLVPEVGDGYSKIDMDDDLDSPLDDEPGDYFAEKEAAFKVPTVDDFSVLTGDEDIDFEADDDIDDYWG